MGYSGLTGYWGFAGGLDAKDEGNLDAKEGVLEAAYLVIVV